jgi:ribosome biogenesis GTPase / thiamine phosphate phosphatase
MSQQDGVVVKSTGSWYLVRFDDGELLRCRMRGKIRMQGLKTTNPVAVGDKVTVIREDKGDEETGVITAIHDRFNYLARKSVNLSKRSHILAANIDRIYLLVTLVAPVTHLAFIDRFLVSAESFRIPTTLLFNKSDLYLPEDMEVVHDMMAIYENVGYPCHTISALNLDNIAFLREEIKDKQVMIAGHSGSGKSTLVNALDPNLNARVGEISMVHLQGQHTTTFAEMYPLSSGGYIIDTPGIKAFGLVDLDKSVLSHYFPEMRAVLTECKFHNCRHLSEPGCRVKELVESGKISDSRYYNYVQMMEEDEEELYRKNIYG